MALNSKPAQLELIQHMIQSFLTTSPMAHITDCRKQLIVYTRSNLQTSSNVQARCNGVGRPRIIIPFMLEALCEHLRRSQISIKMKWQYGSGTKLENM